MVDARVKPLISPCIGRGCVFKQPKNATPEVVSSNALVSAVLRYTEQQCEDN